MLLIGSTGRNSGKTVLACSIISRMSRVSPVIGLKVTTIHGEGVKCPRGGEGCGVCSSLEGDWCVTKETDTDSGKDTTKMLKAGAGEVFWLRVRAGRMKEAVQALRDLLPPGIPVIAESNTLRRVVEPGVFLIVRPRGSTEIKPSAKRVLEYADRIIEGDKERTSIDEGDISFLYGRFILKKKATLVLLAGGGSSRMGTPKSLLEYKGRSLLTYINAKLAPLFSEVYISLSSQEQVPAGLDGAKVVVDELAGRGPIAGIAAGLRAAAYERVFVIACDIPTVHPGLISDMLRCAKNCDVVVPRTEDGYLEPLHAVYKRTVLRQLDELIDSGEKRIRELYGKVKTCYKDLKTDQNLRNINTPEEYRSILASGTDEPPEQGQREGLYGSKA